MMQKKKWYDYFWIWTILFFVLGFFNILFAWLGLFDMFTPLILAIFGGNKFFCNHMCGRSQLLALIPQVPEIINKKRIEKWKKLGAKGECPKAHIKLCRNVSTPTWMTSKWFRCCFLIFFFSMFGNVLCQTWLVFGGADLDQTLSLFSTFHFPWNWAYTINTTPAWVAQFAFSFYSLMLSSTLIGLVLMILYKPRTWCGFCPMGTMTQLICKLRHRKEIANIE